MVTVMMSWAEKRDSRLHIILEKRRIISEGGDENQNKDVNVSRGVEQMYADVAKADKTPVPKPRPRLSLQRDKSSELRGSGTGIEDHSDEEILPPLPPKPLDIDSEILPLQAMTLSLPEDIIPSERPEKPKRIWEYPASPDVQYQEAVSLYPDEDDPYSVTEEEFQHITTQPLVMRSPPSATYEDVTDMDLKSLPTSKAADPALYDEIDNITPGNRAATLATNKGEKGKMLRILKALLPKRRNKSDGDFKPPVKMASKDNTSSTKAEHDNEPYFEDAGIRGDMPAYSVVKKPSKTDNSELCLYEEVGGL